MSKHTVIQVVGAHMTALRQLKGDRLSYARLMLPQSVKDNTLYTSKDRKLYTFEAPDTVLFPVELLMADDAEVNDTVLNEMFVGINMLFGSASQQAEIEVEDVVEIPEVPEALGQLIDLEKLIKKGKYKKAKKLLDEIKDEVDYKKYKKIIKDLK